MIGAVLLIVALLAYVLTGSVALALLIAIVAVLVLATPYGRRL